MVSFPSSLILLNIVFKNIDFVELFSASIWNYIKMKFFENSISSSVIHFISVKNILKFLGSSGFLITAIFFFLLSVAQRSYNNLVQSKAGSSIKVLGPRYLNERLSFLFYSICSVMLIIINIISTSCFNYSKFSLCDN